MSKQVVAIDLGSNSIRFLKIDCRSQKVLGEFHKTVKTADGLSKSGVISQEAIQRIILAILEAQTIIDFTGAKVKAVTTQALRQASNSDEVLEIIFEKTGVSLEIIDGETEAMYALLATKNRLKLLGEVIESFMIADIGGGSTEIIFSYHDRVISKSFSIGIVTLTQSYNTINEIQETLPTLMQEMGDFIEDVYSTYGRVQKFIATAGTPTTIAAMKLGMSYKSYDSSKINGTLLSKEEVQYEYKNLLKMSEYERIRYVGVGREDLIASGILIYDRIYTLSGFESSIVIDDGIREGVAYSICKS